MLVMLVIEPPLPPPLLVVGVTVSTATAATYDPIAGSSMEMERRRKRLDLCDDVLWKLGEVSDHAAVLRDDCDAPELS